MVAEVYVSCGILTVTSGAWIPLRWQISTVVGVERMLVVLPALSVSVMVLRVSEKLRSWSEGASVIITGTVAVAAVRLVASGAMALEHPRTRAAARPRLPAIARKRDVLAFIVDLRVESEEIKLSGSNRRVYTRMDYRCQKNLGKTGGY